MSKSLKLLVSILVVCVFLLAWQNVSHASITGLNQIPTPKTQPKGILSLEAQYQDVKLGNSLMLKEDLGLTSHLEVSVDEGLDPGKYYVNAEYNIIDVDHVYVSAGVLNWSLQNGTELQSFVEGGLYTKTSEYVLGAVFKNNTLQPMVGYSYLLGKRLKLMADYEGGRNSNTALGVAYNLTKALQIRPEVYLSDKNFHTAEPYVEVCYSF